MDSNKLPMSTSAPGQGPMTVTSQMQMVPRPQGPPQQIMSTNASTVASNLTSGGFTQVRPLQVTSTAIRGQGLMRPQGTPTGKYLFFNTQINNLIE